MPLLPGEILNKRYRIVNLLGQGDYGAVYRAWDQTASHNVARNVAIKEYLDASIETQKRFRAEARRLSRLNHPQLPTVRDHFALEDVGQYLVSDYIDGVDLASLLNQYGPQPSDLIITWLQAVCEPLVYLHTQNQQHLNIKPANIRQTPDGTVFLVDTGLPGLGIRPHNNGFGAPEQQAQSEVTAVTDIYSLGATLYTLLTNQIPPNALERESGLQDLKPAREVNPDIEPYLSLVAARAMSIRPDTRYDSAAEFAKALARPSGFSASQTAKPRRTTAGTAVATNNNQSISPPAPRLPASRRRQIERRTMIGLSTLLGVIIILALLFGVFNLGGFNNNSNITEAEATATLESAVVAALTAIAPTPTPSPFPTEPPTPTPEPLITDTGSRMIYIGEGIFRMGSDESEQSNEQPAHLVRLDAYYIDETEVTNQEYAQCVDAGVCAAPDSPNASFHGSYFGNEKFDDYPVIFVSWFDADTFCTWRKARLPSEAEWEKAAGFDPVEGLKYQFPWGDEFDGQNLNYCDVNCPRDYRDAQVDDGHQDTAPVGTYINGRSPTGIYDMAGNIMEWVGDWYDPRYYRDSADTNPLGPLEGEFKAMRGGSWLSPSEETSVTARDSFDPNVSRTNLGFRCALTPQ